MRRGEMELTKEEAIQLTYELWSWLKENKQTSKDNWPGWKKYGSMKHACPCCQFVNSEQEDWKMMHGDDCIKSCPLINIWPAKRSSDKVPCCRKGSPFQRFEEFEDDDKDSMSDKYIDKITKIIINMESAIKKEMKRLKIKPLINP
jgi:hypothetical protein